MEMTEMKFLPVLQQFLNTYETIYTVRKYRMTDEAVVVVNVGTCQRAYVDTVLKGDLKPYVEESGFGSLEAWWNKIQAFAGSGPYYLYRVTKLRSYTW